MAGENAGKTIIATVSAVIAGISFIIWIMVEISRDQDQRREQAKTDMIRMIESNSQRVIANIAETNKRIDRIVEIVLAHSERLTATEVKLRTRLPDFTGGPDAGEKEKE